MLNFFVNTWEFFFIFFLKIKKSTPYIFFSFLMRRRKKAIGLWRDGCYLVRMMIALAKDLP